MLAQRLPQPHFQPRHSLRTSSLKPLTPRFALTRLFQQFLDQTRCFELVEGFDTLAEPILCELINFGFIEFVFVSDLQNQLALFIGAGPLVILGLVMTVAIAVRVTPLDLGSLGKNPTC